VKSRLPAILEGTFHTIIEYFRVDSAVSNERNLVSAVSMPALEPGKVTGLSELTDEHMDLPSARAKFVVVNPVGS
jgi:hypothetical protein